MIARTYLQLTTSQEQDQLTPQDLIILKGQKEVLNSTYEHRYGQRIRLMNSMHSTYEFKVPALYEYNKEDIEYLQATYSNVTPFMCEITGSPRILDLIVPTSNTNLPKRATDDNK